MDCNLSIQEVRPTLKTATIITSSGFVQPVSDSLTEDVQDHISTGDIIYSIMDRDKTIGFAVFDVLPGSILLLSGIMLEANYQAQGITQAIIGQAREETKTKFLSLRTQSLRMWRVGAKVCAGWYPSNGDGIPDVIQERGEIVAERLKADFPVSFGFYDGPLYGEKPVYRDEELQTWWDNLCSFEGGDAVICVGQF